MGRPELGTGKWLGGMEEVGVDMVVGAGGALGGGCSAGTSVPPLSEPMSSSESLPPVSKGMLCGGRASSQNKGFRTMDTL